MPEICLLNQLIQSINLNYRVFKKYKMKKVKFLILVAALFATFSCDKDEAEKIGDFDVEKYIILLKTGQYKPLELPAFTDKDIPALLEYRDETQLITDFPINGISSLWLSECTLGMYVLWTVESIRAVAIESENLIGRFPSLNPIVQKREDPSSLEYGAEAHNVISQAYFDWWEENKHKDFNDFKDIDPLLKTIYSWH